MWETPFDESMLDKSLIIHCPDESLATELMELLEKNGVLWVDGQEPTGGSKWHRNREATCYWVEPRGMSYENMDWAETHQDEYANHIKCTFYGKDEQIFEPANDSEMQGFLGF